MAGPALHTTHIHYPSSDGMPMAESDFQREPLSYAVQALRVYFQNRHDVYVSGNLFIYYEEDNPKAAVAPDVFVVFGAAGHDRSSYKLWEEPKAPDFVLEITSRSTRSEDQGAKRGTYAYLGVQEYVQYDPTGDYLTPPLKGFRLAGENYEPMPSSLTPTGTAIVHSDVLGLDLRIIDGDLRFYDPVTQQKLLSLQESEQARQESEQARVSAEVRAQTAEARLAELEARLRALTPPPEPPASA